MFSNVNDDVTDFEVFLCMETQKSKYLSIFKYAQTAYTEFKLKLWYMQYFRFNKGRFWRHFGKAPAVELAFININGSRQAFLKIVFHHRFFAGNFQKCRSAEFSELEAIFKTIHWHYL